MVYIYRKHIGSKDYYYLRASHRKNGRIITKDIAYLGDSLEAVQRRLNNLPQYARQIRKTYKTLQHFIDFNRYAERVRASKPKADRFLGANLIAVEASKLHYKEVFQKQDDLTQRDTLKQFIIEFAFNTTSIEGNTITLREARDLLEEGRTPKGKTLREVYDLQNTEAMLMEMTLSPPTLTHEVIERMHAQLMADVDARTGYRTTDIRVLRSTFTATPAPYVRTDMELLLKWLEAQDSKLHPFVLAAIFHHKFEKIHPFMDGNGRTGRLLLNALLLHNGYPPLIIRLKDRQRYLAALHQADKASLIQATTALYKPLVAFLAEQLTESYWNSFL